MDIEIPNAERITQVVQKPVSTTAVILLPDTERHGYGVIEYEGHRDDDFGQGEYHRERVIELYEEEEVAKSRADALEKEHGYQTDNTSGGEYTCVYSYKGYKTGVFMLSLCIVEQGEKNGNDS